MRLLVSEIHPVNLLMFWLLSFFVRVEAFQINRMCPKILYRRIETIDLEKYLSWNDTSRVKSRVMQMWEEFHEKFPRKHWNCFYRGRSLDFTTKAKQDLASDFERLVLFQEMREYHRAEGRAFIIDSPQFRYLRSRDPSAGLFRYARLPLVSQANVYLDLMFIYAHNLMQMLLLLRAMVRGWLKRDSGHPQRVPFIWDAVNRPEFSVDPERRFYPWIVDGKHITKQDVLFILPAAADRKSIPQLYSSGYNAATILELYRRVPLRILSARIRDLLFLIAGYLLPMPKSLASIRMAGYRCRTIRFMSAVEHVGPACYITSLTRYGVEDPATVYLNSIGVETVMWCHSGTASMFVSDEEPCDFREIGLSNVLVSRMVVWHDEFRKLIEVHIQDKTKVDVIGPMMSGEETVLQLPKEVLRNRMGIRPTADSDNMRYISIFDIPPLSGGDKSATSPWSWPYPYTEEYSLAFLRDMVRLLEDFDNVALIFKPKRSVATAYPSEFKELVARLQKSGRGLAVDHDVNPWAPIALADLCIGMPFTSPPLAAMHYGIPGLYHDPTGVALQHRHRSHSVTHGYDQLRSKVCALASEPPGHDRDKESVWSESRGFTGEYPGTNSTERFRELLTDIANNTR